MSQLLVLVLLLTGAKAADRPNIIFIIADDLGWNDVGFHGSDQIPTPNLDRLATEGVILNNYYVQPVCTPTRAAILTGRYPIHLGLQHNVILAPEPFGLDLGEKLLPEYLEELGYVNRAVGKWHLGFYAANYTPTRRGFDSFYGYWTGEEDYWDHTAGGGRLPLGGWGLDLRRDMEADFNAFGQYSTELFTNESVTIIENHDKSKPLFLYLAHQAVHAGNDYRILEAPYKYYEKLVNIRDPDRRQFAAMVVALDVSVGHVYEALSRNNMLKNTVIVFTTDNGGPAAHFQGNMANNWPLRGVKTTLWEGGVRGAAFIWSPLLKSSARVSHQLMHASDWFPTLLDVARYNDTKSLQRNLDGISQWKTLSENLPSKRKEILHNIDNNGTVFAVRVGDFKLISPNWAIKKYFGWFEPEEVYADTTLKFQPKDFSSIEYDFQTFEHTNEALFSFDDGEMNMELSEIHSKLENASKQFGEPKQESAQVICGPIPPDASTNCQPGTPCLYHIPTDPCEFHNIYSKSPEIARLLYMRFLAYNSSAVPSRNQEPDPKSNPAFFKYTWSPWVKLDAQGRETYVITDDD